jgi:hypothetical protein
VGQPSEPIILVALQGAVDINARDPALFVVLVVQGQYPGVFDADDPAGGIVSCDRLRAVAVGDAGLLVTSPFL